MIGRLIGKLAAKRLPLILVDVNGVGYEVSVPLTTAYQLPDMGHNVTLFTHLVIREDSEELCGFAREVERDLFRTLLKVNGIGPKVGLSILSGMDAPTLIKCVAEEDTHMLTTIPGIGKKTAERLIIELKDRLEKWDARYQVEGKMPHEVVDFIPASSAKLGDNEAVSALVALGYKPQDAKRAVESVGEGKSLEETIKLALQSMLKRHSQQC